MPSVPILLYHNQQASGFQFKTKAVVEQHYCLNMAQFEQQMAYIAEQGFNSLLPQQMRTPLPEKPIVISFDNGHESQHRLALPILKKYGLRAVFFITTDYIEQDNYMTVAQLRDLQQQGMEIGSHGVSHQSLDDVPNIEIEHELTESQKILSRLLKKKIVSFSMPNGKVHAEMKHRTASYYRHVFGGHFGFYQPEKGRFNIPRLAIKRGLTFEQFQNLLQQNPALIRQLYWQDRLLSVAKFVLGKEAYHVSRTALLQYFYKKNKINH